MTPKNRAAAFAPATVANVAVGFDILGFATDTVGDRVFVEKTQIPGITIESIRGITQTLPLAPEKNTATLGLLRLCEDLQLPYGFRVTIEKGIPLGSGMGGSAASAVAALVAANALLDKALDHAALLPYALLGESIASGSLHADNIVPCLVGGLTLARAQPGNDGSLPKVEYVSIPTPKQIFCVLVHPNIIVETKGARSILAKQIELPLHVQQSTNLAQFLAACFTNNISLLKHSMHDILIEPQRAHLIPGFPHAKAAALENGAISCSISGAGPSVFAWSENLEIAESVKHKICEAFSKAGVETHAWISPISQQGARLL